MAATFSYQAGGALKGDFPGYVERPADKELLHAFQEGEFCYVLTARQMGKSSLKVRAIQQLRDSGWLCADLDITRFGSSGANAEQWYFSFLYELSRTFHYEDEFEDWWDERANLTPVAKFSAYFQEFICQHTTENIGIFIDEIDSVLSLNKEKFSTDDFFAAIRAVYNEQAGNKELRRIHFCILGVATPNDLMEDPSRTPFNIGRAINLQNLKLSDSTPLLPGLGEDAELKLSRVLYWSGGQPYLTQRICQASIQQNLSIDDVVVQLFLQPDSLDNEANLSNVQRRMQTKHPSQVAMLSSYAEILRNGSIKVDFRRPEQVYLSLTGIVRTDKGQLVVNNQIYKELFDLGWVNRIYEQLNRPFTIALTAWQANEKDEKYLLRGSALREALDWSVGREDLSLQEKTFLDESRNRELDLEARTRRILAVSLTIISLLAITTLVFLFRSFNQQKELEASAERLTLQMGKADSSAFVADSLRGIAVNREGITLQKADSLRAVLEQVIILESDLRIALSDARIQRDTAEQRRIRANLLRVEEEKLRLISEQLAEQAQRSDSASKTYAKELEKVRESLQLNSFAQAVRNTDPSLALWLAYKGYQADANDIIEASLRDIYPKGPYYNVLKKTDRYWKQYLDEQKGIGVYSKDDRFLISASHNSRYSEYEQPNAIFIKDRNGKEDLIAYEYNIVRSSASYPEYTAGLAVSESTNANGRPQMVATSTTEGFATVWDVQTGTVLDRFSFGNDTLESIAFFFQDRKLVVLDEASLVIRDIGSQSQERTIDFSSRGLQISSYAVSHDQQILMLGHDDGSVSLIHASKLNTREDPPNILIQSGEITSLNFSPNDQFMGVGNESGRINIVKIPPNTGNEEIRELEVVKDLKGISEKIEAVFFHSEEPFVIARTAENLHGWYMLNDPHVPVKTASYSARLWSLAVNEAENYLITGAADRSIQVWDKNTQKILHTLKGFKGLVWDVSSTNPWILGGSTMGELLLWDSLRDPTPQYYQGLNSRIWATGFISQKEWVFAAGDDQKLLIWDRVSTNLVQSIELAFAAQSVIYDEQEDHFLISGSRTEIAWLVWDPVKKKYIRKGILEESFISGDFRLTTTRFGVPLLATVSEEGLRVYRSDSGGSLLEFVETGQTEIQVVPYCIDMIQKGDHALIAVGGKGGIIELYTLGMGWNGNLRLLSIYKLPTGTGSIWDCQFTDNGERLITVDENGQLTTWDLPLNLDRFMNKFWYSEGYFRNLAKQRGVPLSDF